MHTYILHIHWAFYLGIFISLFRFYDINKLFLILNIHIGMYFFPIPFLVLLLSPRFSLSPLFSPVFLSPFLSQSFFLCSLFLFLLFSFLFLNFIKRHNNSYQKQKENMTLDINEARNNNVNFIIKCLLKMKIILSTFRII